jgi:hypothetical protein
MEIDSTYENYTKRSATNADLGEDEQSEQKVFKIPRTEPTTSLDDQNGNGEVTEVDNNNHHWSNVSNLRK